MGTESKCSTPSNILVCLRLSLKIINYLTGSMTVQLRLGAKSSQHNSKHQGEALAHSDSPIPVAAAPSTAHAAVPALPLPPPEEQGPRPGLPCPRCPECTRKCLPPGAPSPTSQSACPPSHTPTLCIVTGPTPLCSSHSSPKLNARPPPLSLFSL